MRHLPQTAAGEPEKGPFLGGITTRYNRAELLEAILRPSAKVAQGFATNWFETTDNRKLEGFVDPRSRRPMS